MKPLHSRFLTRQDKVPWLPIPLYQLYRHLNLIPIPPMHIIHRVHYLRLLILIDILLPTQLLLHLIQQLIQPALYPIHPLITVVKSLIQPGPRLRNILIAAGCLFPANEVFELGNCFFEVGHEATFVFEGD